MKVKCIDKRSYEVKVGDVYEVEKVTDWHGSTNASDIVAKTGKGYLLKDWRYPKYAYDATMFEVVEDTFNVKCINDENYRSVFGGHSGLKVGEIYTVTKVNDYHSASENTLPWAKNGKGYCLLERKGTSNEWFSYPASHFEIVKPEQSMEQQEHKLLTNVELLRKTVENLEKNIKQTQANLDAIKEQLKQIGG